MKKKKYLKIFSWVFILLIWILIFASKLTNKWLFVLTPDLESKPGIKILDANNPYFSVVKESNRIYGRWKDTKITMKQMKCRMNKPRWKYIYVNAKINDNEYPLIIDTGFQGSLLVNDLVVTDNNLELYPITNIDSSFSGFCHIDKIQFGDIAIENPESYYRPGHYEKKILGLTIHKQKKIGLGLRIMSLFKYILIDNVGDELEFSMVSFSPDPNETWNQYNMRIDNSRTIPNLMVNIPIAGENTEIAFDSGYDCCLIMTEKIWEQYSKKLTKVKEKNSSVGLLSGYVDAQEVTIDKLNMCDMTFENETIDVFSNDNRFGPDFFMFGMDCFKNTAIVLDFENNLFWVRKITQ
ncbi:MAG: hypothetical protein JXA96_17080 [Sedimentisphaerales bacterium]|nr:hypothetical protein [Sedimentisphaerales bacterium]